MRQTTVRGTLSLRGFRKLRTGAIVATGVILLGLGFLAPTVSANEQDGVWVARTVAEVKADIQNIDKLSHYTIKWGDTLSAISGATGLSVDSLVEINRIANRDLIFANNKLYFSEEAFLKDGNTEVKRQRVSIDNSGSYQSYEVETKTDTVTGEQTTTVKQTTPVVVETPAVSAPKSETSVSVAPKAETKAESSNSSTGVTNKGHSGASTPVTETTPSNAETTNQPVVSNPSSEAPAPKVEEPAATEPKSDEPVATDPSGTTPKAEEAVPPASKAEEPAPKSEEPASSTPKVEEPAAPAPKVEEPATPAPKVEEPATSAPKAEEPAATEPKTEEPVTPALKAEEPAATEPKSDEPVATDPSGTTPKAEEAVPPASKAEEPATPAPKTEEPASGTTPKAEEPVATMPKSDEPATPASKVEEPAAPAPKVEEPTTPAPKSEEPASSTPKVEAPVATADPKADEPTATIPKVANPTEVAPKDEKLEEAKKDGKDIIEKIASSKLSEIEKVKEEAEKTKLKEKLNELKEEALAAINNAKDHDAAVAVADEYQTKIDEIDVPGEELPAPNYNKDNLTNGRNEGTTIDNGSTAIGHGSGEAPTQPATEERSTSTASPTQPASTETTAGTSSFRNAPSVQARARRVARSTSEPDGTVNISYNFAGMPDIHGFLSDPGENNTVMIPAGTNEEQAKELVKEKIQAKIKDLAARGYYVKNDIIFEQDTTVKNYNYVVTFTKEATGTSGFRMAPAVQPRASRNRRSIEQPAPQKVKVNVFITLIK